MESDGRVERPEGGVFLIAAAGADMAVGRAGSLPWRLPGDMAEFKRLTTGSVVVMGRGTFESMGKRPLPGRVNVVVTKSPGFEVEKTGAESAGSFMQALLKARSRHSGKPVFAIGGEGVWREASKVAEGVFLTLVDGGVEGADAWFPKDVLDGWVEAWRSGDFEENGVSYRFTRWRRIGGKG